MNDELAIERDADGNLIRKSAATWVTGEEKPDPKVEVLNEAVCIRPINLATKIKTKSGLVLETTARSTERQESVMSVGRVVGVGEYAGKRANVSRVNVGDYVLFPKYSSRVTIQGVKVVFVPDDAVFARVNKEDIELDVTL